MKELVALLVEDNPIDAQIVQRTAENFSVVKIRFTVCKTLAEAELALKEHRFDVILLDLYLPDCGEVEGLRRLISLYPETPIVVYTGAYTYELAYQCFEIGAADCVDKEVINHKHLMVALLNANAKFVGQKRKLELANRLDEIARLH